MRRAVIFVTLALLLLAVAGVTIAQEGAFRGDEPRESTTETTSPEDTLSETTASETTAPETTLPETTAPEVTAPDPGRPGPNDQETTKPDPEQPDDENEPVEEPPLEANVAGGIEENGRPEGERSADSGGEAEGQADDGPQQKVMLCHKGEVTISVGAPAQAAHLRHGDALGTCDAGSEGVGVSKEADEPSGRGEGPPADRGRPDSAGKPDDAGKKPEKPQNFDEERVSDQDAADSSASPGKSADKPAGKSKN